jgi:MFS family permease
MLPFYYGWFIVALSFLANLTAAGIRSAPSVLIHPLEAEFGWSRTEVASAASLNLLLLGLFAPVGGWLIDRIGARRVILGSLSTIALGLIAVTFVQQLWQLILLWGVVLGVATGITPALGASIASRWFVDRRGLAVGIMTNANAAGQIVFLPLLMSVILAAGWRTALMMITAAACFLIPAIWFWMRDRPSEVGLEPYRSGAGANAKPGKSFARGEIRGGQHFDVLDSRRLLFYLRCHRQRSDWHAPDPACHRARHSAGDRGDHASQAGHHRETLAHAHALGPAEVSKAGVDAHSSGRAP